MSYYPFSSIVNLGCDPYIFQQFLFECRRLEAAQGLFYLCSFVSFPNDESSPSLDVKCIENVEIRWLLNRYILMMNLVPRLKCLV